MHGGQAMWPSRHCAVLFCLAGHGRAATIHVDTADYKGVYLAALNLGTDIGKVTGTKADVSTDLPMGQGTVIAGTLGRNRRIDEWVKQGKLTCLPSRGNGRASWFKRWGEPRDCGE